MKTELTEVEIGFLEPEQNRLYRELEALPKTADSHARRRDIGDRLSVIGDTRKGVGLRKDGVPDIEWLPVEGGEIEIEREKFKVESFFIAKYLVTYRQFKAFIDATDGYQNEKWWAGMPEEYVRHEIVEQRTKSANNPRDSISWYQSVAFSRWLTVKYAGEKLVHPNNETFEIGANAVIRIPLEWEWQWAAQGGGENREYPWVGGWKEGYSNTSEAGLGRAIGVGMYVHGEAKCGALDMAGQLWEWCLNCHDYSPTMNYMNEYQRVQRGGSFDLSSHSASCAYRDYYYPSYQNNYNGVRVIVSRPVT